VDSISNELFKIQFEPNEDSNPQHKKIRDFDSVVILPMNIGCTGRAIKHNKVIYFNKGEQETSNYQGEVDNCVSSSKVDSFMVSAIRDTNGKLRGVV